ncbi:MAG TPA: toprim domain-containing protein [Panacibacter sp.]|nr:toprim domain-containing protein [Panacibacter sp.]
MKTRQLTCADARQIDLVEYLELLGCKPQQIRQNNYWYLSPLREEKTASFKVNRKLNVWYDFGMGKGGDLIDFGVLFHHCTIPQLLEKLGYDYLSFQQHLCPQNAAEKPSIKNIEKDAAAEEKIVITSVKKIIDPFLCRYLHERRILLDIAGEFCNEIHFKIKDKNYYAIGFKNDAGGYELRSRFFKLSSAPKSITLLNKNAKSLQVFEGFFSFLSYKTILQNQSSATAELQNSQHGFLILNSISFFEKSRKLMEQHEQIHLFLDRDKAGLLQTEKALKLSKQYKDESHLYKGYKDLNDWLTGKKMCQKQGHSLW